VICNASKLHSANVTRIEELIGTCNQQSETIKTLVGGGGGGAGDPTFASDASRMTGAPAGKRSRLDMEGHNTTTTTTTTNNGAATTTKGGGDDAWDLFGQILHEQSRALYY
jgi:hypothetical protein